MAAIFGEQPMMLTIRRSMYAGLGLVSLLIMLAATANGQSESGSTIRVETNLVTLNIAVSDTGSPGKMGRTIPRLEAGNFTVFEDGVRQEITGFSAAEVPFNLVLLIDTSGSTREDLDLIRNGAGRFLDAIRPNDRLAIVQFNREVELVSDLTADRTRLEEGLRQLERGTGTSFYDAIQLTLDELLGNVVGRKVIVALTDGVDSFGHLTWEKIQPAVEQAGATIHVLRLDTELFTSEGIRKDCRQSTRFEFSAKQLRKYYDEYVKQGPRSLYATHCRLGETGRLEINRRLYQSARRELEQLTRLTGGSLFDVARLSQLEAAYLQIADTLRNVYSISYYPTNDRHDGRWRSVRVEVRQNSRPGLTATTRPGYRASRE